MHNPFSIFDEKSWQFKTVERFIIVLYDNTHEKVNEARREMFCQDGNLESIPPTQDALYLYVLKASS